MEETGVRYPIDVHDYERVDQLEEGKVYPVAGDGYGKGTCHNCKDLTGSLFAVKVLSLEIDHIRSITMSDAHGNLRTVKGKLFRLPCPVCKPDEQGEFDIDKEEEPYNPEVEAPQDRQGELWWQN